MKLQAQRLAAIADAARLASVATGSAFYMWSGVVYDLIERLPSDLANSLNAVDRSCDGLERIAIQAEALSDELRSKIHEADPIDWPQSLLWLAVCALVLCFSGVF